MIEMNNPNCTGCGACQNACSVGAISMIPGADGFIFPKIDKSLCIECGICSKVCPLEDMSPKMTDNNTIFAVRGPLAYRKTSSSGAAFRLLAEGVLNNGGVVCGAKLLDSDRVEHAVADNEHDLLDLLGSKYVQSDMKDIFKVVRKFLDEQKEVLFCGTPCQAHSLKKYLDYHNVNTDELILVDLVCAGVESPLFFDIYMKWIRGKYGELKDFRFRDKITNNSGHTVSWKINDQLHTELFTENIFCRIYTKQLGLRKSCYSCKYAAPNRVTDITLGDFWGNDDIIGHLIDGYGISMVITHTPKGNRLLKQLSDNFRGTVVEEIEGAIDFQPRLMQPPQNSILNKLFTKDLVAGSSSGAWDMNMFAKKYGS